MFTFHSLSLLSRALSLLEKLRNFRMWRILSRLNVLYKRVETTVQQSINCLSGGYVSCNIWITTATNRFSSMRYCRSRSSVRLIHVVLVLCIDVLHQHIKKRLWKYRMKTLYGIESSFLWGATSVFCQSHREWIDGQFCLPRPSVLLTFFEVLETSQNSHLSCHPGLLCVTDPLADLTCTLLGRMKMELLVLCDLACFVSFPHLHLIWCQVFCLVFVVAGEHFKFMMSYTCGVSVKIRNSKSAVYTLK
jgi:hypothetical protein